MQTQICFHTFSSAVDVQKLTGWYGNVLGQNSQTHASGYLICP